MLGRLPRRRHIDIGVARVVRDDVLGRQRHLGIGAGRQAGSSGRAATPWALRASSGAGRWWRVAGAQIGILLRLDLGLTAPVDVTLVVLVVIEPVGLRRIASAAEASDQMKIASHMPKCGP